MMPLQALPDELRPTAATLVAELRDNPLLSGFSAADLVRYVCSVGFRRTLEREHLAIQSGFRQLGDPDGDAPLDGGP